MILDLHKGEFRAFNSKLNCRRSGEDTIVHCHRKPMVVTNEGIGKARRKGKLSKT